MSKQMPWSEHEAVILLDGYLESKHNRIPRLKIVKEISKKLRQMAINQGIEIDEIYRNENGISFQMTSMASAYEMTNKGKPATKLFSEIAEIYRNNNEMYQILLLEAKSMIDGYKNYRFEFTKFIHNKDPENQEKLLQAIDRIEGFAVTAKVIKASSIFLDFNNALPELLRKQVLGNNFFIIRNRQYLHYANLALNYLEDFIFNNCSNASNSVPDTEPIDNNTSVSISDTEPIDNNSSDSVPDTEPIDNNASNSVPDTEPIDNNASVSISDTELIDNIESSLKDKCNLILLENFEEGYRIGNYMHQMRFINLYNSNFNSQLDKQPSEIDDLLKSIGRLVDDRIFASDGNDANDIIKDVTECIKSTFDNGASSIFYECLYERFKDKLISEMNIYSSETLKSALQSDINLRMYSFNKTHITKIGSSNDIESEITSILIESHVPISYNDIQKILWYIPFDSIRYAVSRIKNAAYVGDSSYIYAPNFNISSDELSKLITAMHNAIYSKGYIVAKDLQELYIKNCPFSAMDSSDYKDYAIREILRALLKDKFNFSTSVISEIGTNFTYGDIYENYAKERDIVTVSELQELSSELGVQIYWDSIMNQMIRISPSELVNKRLFNFDIEAVDKHLESICDGDYVLLKDIRLYLSFPPLNYKWNGFILYSYLLLFSRKFNLIRHGFAPNECFGAMVKNTSQLQSYEQVAADILSKDNSWNDEKSALKCLINAGLQKKNANKHIASIIKMAKQIRNNKQ